MPSGPVHSTATIALAAGLGVAAYYQAWPVAPLVGGVLAGLVVTPDLDVDQGSISQKIVRRAGCLLGAIWAVWWWPYAQLIPHRHWMSHMPVISTVIRIAYLLWPVILYRISAGLPVPGWAIWAAGGLAAADALHWLMDQTLRN